MRCQDVREQLLHRLNSESTSVSKVQVTSHETELEAHLRLCSACRVFKRQHVFSRLDNTSPTPPATPTIPVQHVPSVSSPSVMSVPGHVSTSSIMLAVKRQEKITQQVEHMQQQQQVRVARMRTGGLAFALLTFLALGSIPLVLAVILLVQTDMMVNLLSFLRSIIDVGYVLALSLQTALIVVTHNNLLLSLLAFVVVLMMAMWIRLMRPHHDV